MFEYSDGRAIQAKHDDLLAKLAEFEAQVHAEWCDSIDSSVYAKLNQSLVTRDPYTKLVSVNFHPVIVRLLKETKYMIALGCSIPSSVVGIYQQVRSRCVGRWLYRLCCRSHANRVHTAGGGRVNCCGTTRRGWR